MTSPVKKLVATWPVIEVFGPTIQGEGVDQGVACHFIRFGGCDYRCTWCDTPYAVLPNEVRANATRMNALDLRRAVVELGPAAWVILSGGNPALHDLTDLVDELHAMGYLVAVETQGSRWRDWMRDLDRICVSPKPPSAEEPKTRDMIQLSRFLEEGMKARVECSKPYEWLFLKVVCFTEEDVEFAELMRSQLSDALLYLSAGNDAGRTVGNPTRVDSRGISGVRLDLLNKTAWLVSQVLSRPDLCTHDVFVQHQLHTALWGNVQGV